MSKAKISSRAGIPQALEEMSMGQDHKANFWSTLMLGDGLRADLTNHGLMDYVERLIELFAQLPAAPVDLGCATGPAFAAVMSHVAVTVLVGRRVTPRAPEWRLCRELLAAVNPRWRTPLQPPVLLTRTGETEPNLRARARAAIQVKSELTSLPDDIVCEGPSALVSYCSHDSQLALSAVSCALRRTLLTRGWPRFDGSLQQKALPKTVLARLPFCAKGLRARAANVDELLEVISATPGVGRLSCDGGPTPAPASLQHFVGELGYIDADSDDEWSSDDEDQPEPFPLSAIVASCGTTGLRSLILNGSGLDGDLAVLAPLVNLTKLSISLFYTDAEQPFSLLRGDIASLAPLVFLASLTLFQCEDIIGDISSLTPLGALAHLDLKNCFNLNGSIVEASPPVALTDLTLSRCWSLDLGLASLTPLTALVHLDLSDSGEGVHGELESITPLINLTSLHLSANFDVVGDLSSLSLLVALTSLGISNCSGIEGDLSSLASLVLLEKLRLVDCPTICGDKSSLALLGHLASLTIDSCVNIDDIPDNCPHWCVNANDCKLGVRCSSEEACYDFFSWLAAARAAQLEAAQTRLQRAEVAFQTADEAKVAARKLAEHAAGALKRYSIEYATEKIGMGLCSAVDARNLPQIAYVDDDMYVAAQRPEVMDYLEMVGGKRLLGHVSPKEEAVRLIVCGDSDKVGWGPGGDRPVVLSFVTNASWSEATARAKTVARCVYEARRTEAVVSLSRDYLFARLPPRWPPERANSKRSDCSLYRAL